MDSCKQVISALKALNNQTCLAALANMGEYKRALKELQNGKPSISFADEKFKVKIGGETVTLGEKRESFRCTCPSPLICRHIIAGVIAVAESADYESESTGEGAPAAQTEPPKPVTLDKDGIRKLVGDKIFQSATERYYSAHVEITSSNPPSALVNGHKTVFLSSDAGDSVCSCKKSVCEHRAIALLKMWSDRTGEQVVADFSLPDSHTLELIESCLGLLSRLLVRGLYSATAVDSQLIMFYSLNLSKYAAPLGVNLRSLSQLLEEVTENKLFTDDGRLLYHYCKAYNLLSAVSKNALRGDALAMLLQSEKKAYYPVSKQTLISLGCYPFFTETGYVGASHIFVCNGETFSLSAVFPTIYSDYDEDEILNKAKNQTEAVLSSVSGCKIVLSDFKSNGARLSLTENTTVQNLGVAVDEFASLDVYESDYAALERSVAARDYFGASSARRFVVPYDGLQAELNDYGTVEITLILGNRELIAVMDLNEATKSACKLLTESRRKNGYAVLENYGGDFILRALFEGGSEVNLYFEGFKKRRF